MISESVESKEVVQDDGLTKMGISNVNCDDGMVHRLLFVHWQNANLNFEIFLDEFAYRLRST